MILKIPLFFLIIASPILSLAADPSCPLVKTALVSSSALRHLALKKEVPCKTKSRADVEKYLRLELNKKEVRARLENEGEIYKILGYIPASYPYLDGLISLYVSQIGGYYEPKQDYYAMADWIPSSLQLPIAVHELTHALQDQYFHLEKFMDNEKQSTDTLLARSALVEGDATLVMVNFTRQQRGMPPLEAESSAASVLFQNILGTLLSPQIASAPATLQATMIFPYMSGLEFAHNVIKKGGYTALDKVFVNPPRSTSEILHPERYYNREPVLTLAPLPATEGAFKRITSDTFGEFFLSTWLSQFVSPTQASTLASAWAGDEIALYKNDQGEKKITWQIAIRTKKTADEIISALNQKKAQASKEDAISRLSFSEEEKEGYTLVSIH
jgi:hypothetical protein